MNKTEKVEDKKNLCERNNLPNNSQDVLPTNENTQSITPNPLNLNKKIEIAWVKDLMINDHQRVFIGKESDQTDKLYPNIDQFVVKEFKIENTPSIILPAVQMEIQICKTLHTNPTNHLMKVIDCSESRIIMEYFPNSDLFE